jgi:hypothetical protein
VRLIVREEVCVKHNRKVILRSDAEFLSKEQDRTEAKKYSNKARKIR